jgi:hypothetical protein
MKQAMYAEIQLVFSPIWLVLMSMVRNLDHDTYIQASTPKADQIALAITAHWFIPLFRRLLRNLVGLLTSFPSVHPTSEDLNKPVFFFDRIDACALQIAETRFKTFVDSRNECNGLFSNSGLH